MKNQITHEEILEAFDQEDVFIDMAEEGHIYAADDLLRYRVQNGMIQGSVKSSFDRWTNSVDFVLNIPNDVLGMRAAIRAMRSRVGTQSLVGGREDNVGPWYRKERKYLKSQLKQEKV